MNNNQDIQTPHNDGNIQENFQRPVVTVTNTLILINLIIFVIKFISLKLQNPDLPDILVDIHLGAKVNYLIADGEYWRYLSAMFIHGDLMHIAFNMIALYSIGNELELIFGKMRFAIIYFTSGLCGSAFSFMFNDNIAVGASGAIFGLFGAHIFLYALNPKTYKLVFSNSVFGIIVFNIIYGFINPGIDNFAHIGGLLGGALTAFAFTNLNYKPNFAVFKYTLPLLAVCIIGYSLTFGTAKYKNSESYYYNKGLFSIVDGKNQIGYNALLEGQKKFNSQRINKILNSLQ